MSGDIVELRSVAQKMMLNQQEQEDQPVSSNAGQRNQPVSAKEKGVNEPPNDIQEEEDEQNEEQRLLFKSQHDQVRRKLDEHVQRHHLPADDVTHQLKAEHAKKNYLHTNYQHPYQENLVEKNTFHLNRYSASTSASSQVRMKKAERDKFNFT